MRTGSLSPASFTELRFGIQISAIYENLFYITYPVIVCTGSYDE